jgi:hypothetical protein
MGISSGFITLIVTKFLKAASGETGSESQYKEKKRIRSVTLGAKYCTGKLLQVEW